MISDQAGFDEGRAHLGEPICIKRINQLTVWSFYDHVVTRDFVSAGGLDPQGAHEDCFLILKFVFLRLVGIDQRGAYEPSIAACANGSIANTV